MMYQLDPNYLKSFNDERWGGNFWCLFMSQILLLT
jgi:hypothetical protein